MKVRALIVVLGVVFLMAGTVSAEGDSGLVGYDPLVNSGDASKKYTLGTPVDYDPFAKQQSRFEYNVQTVLDSPFLVAVAFTIFLAVLIPAVKYSIRSIKKVVKNSKEKREKLMQNEIVSKEHQRTPVHYIQKYARVFVTGIILTLIFVPYQKFRHPAKDWIEFGGYDFIFETATRSGRILYIELLFVEWFALALIIGALLAARIAADRMPNSR